MLFLYTKLELEVLEEAKCVSKIMFCSIRFKVNNEDWLSVRIAFFCFCYFGYIIFF